MNFVLSIDLDPLSCYRELFGLPPSLAEDPVPTVALARFVELCRQLGIRATIFVVGRTLDRPEAVAALRGAQEAGHEIANHTYSHPYSLSRMPLGAITAEINRGSEAIRDVLGGVATGFRAPGYLLGPRVLEAATNAAVRYDSSMLPSLLYRGVKIAALGYLSLRGRNSQALVGDPREAFGPQGPYHPDLTRPWRTGGASLVELPISSVGGLPLTGTLLTVVGKRSARLLAAVVGKREFVQLELHGIDFLDLASDRLDPQLGIQRDLRLPWQRKVETIAAFVEKILKTHQTITLRDVAENLAC